MEDDQKSLIHQIGRGLLIDPQHVELVKLRIHMLQLSETEAVQIVNGTIGLALSNQGSAFIDIRQQILCPTCHSVIQKPEDDWAGISKCSCRRMICKSKLCQSHYGYCEECGEWACAACAKRIDVGGSRRKLIHNTCSPKGSFRIFLRHAFGA